MSEQLPKPEKHLEDRISDWLKTHGYPLEMVVAYTLQNAGYYVVPSASYRDPDTGALREIDLTAQRHCGIDEPVVFQVACTIECKLSPDKPWILFMPHSREDRFVPFDTLASIITVRFLEEIYENPDLENIRLKTENLRLLQPKYVAYGIVRAFTSPKDIDIPYNAALSALKAAVHRISLADDETNRRSTRPICTIVFPAVVTDARLFQCYLNRDEQLEINEISYCQMELKAGVQNATVYAPLISIVNRMAVTQFVADLNEAAEILMQTALQNRDMISKMATEEYRNDENENSSHD
jgi:hypothetical protein